MILKPDYNLVSLFDIDFKELKSTGINAVLFDLDSTVLELLKELKQNFVIAIISNNKREEYISKVQAMSDFPVIGNANKPNPKVMREFLKSVNILPENTVVVGDRPLTDILAGKLLGAKTVLVDSITRESENKSTRFVRCLERLVIRK